MLIIAYIVGELVQKSSKKCLRNIWMVPKGTCSSNRDLRECTIKKFEKVRIIALVLTQATQLLR